MKHWKKPIFVSLFSRISAATDASSRHRGGSIAGTVLVTERSDMRVRDYLTLKFRRGRDTIDDLPLRPA